MPKSLSLRFRNIALTLLGLGLGYLTLCLSTRLLYVAYLSGGDRAITSQFLAFSGVCGIVFALMGGYVSAFFARRSPVKHAALFCTMVSSFYLLPSLLFGSREPVFFTVLNVAIVIAGAMIGGWLRYWQVNSRKGEFTLIES